MRIRKPGLHNNVVKSGKPKPNLCGCISRWNCPVEVPRGRQPYDRAYVDGLIHANRFEDSRESPEGSRTQPPLLANRVSGH